MRVITETELRALVARDRGGWLIVRDAHDWTICVVVDARRVRRALREICDGRRRRPDVRVALDAQHGVMITWRGGTGGLTLRSDEFPIGDYVHVGRQLRPAVVVEA